MVRLFGGITITSAPSDYFLPLKAELPKKAELSPKKTEATSPRRRTPSPRKIVIDSVSSPIKEILPETKEENGNNLSTSEISEESIVAVTGTYDIFYQHDKTIFLKVFVCYFFV